MLGEKPKLQDGKENYNQAAFVKHSPQRLKKPRDLGVKKGECIRVRDVSFAPVFFLGELGECGDPQPGHPGHRLRGDWHGVKSVHYAVPLHADLVCTPDFAGDLLEYSVLQGRAGCSKVWTSNGFW